jgi:hypothetical protein
MIDENHRGVLDIEGCRKVFWIHGEKKSIMSVLKG